MQDMSNAHIVHQTNTKNYCTVKQMRSNYFWIEIHISKKTYHDDKPNR